MKSSQLRRSFCKRRLRLYFFHSASYLRHCTRWLTSLDSSVILLLLVFGSFSPGMVVAETAGETDAILSTAESTFKAMKLRNYPELWGMLSQKTQDAIVNDVAKAMKKNGARLEKRDVSRDFSEGGLLSGAYWDSYLAAFNPDDVLEHSRWDLGEVGRKEAEILIQYRKAEQPAHLKLFNEKGFWRVGLEETFSGRRIMGTN